MNLNDYDISKLENISFCKLTDEDYIFLEEVKNVSGFSCIEDVISLWLWIYLRQVNGEWTFDNDNQ